VSQAIGVPPSKRSAQIARVGTSHCEIVEAGTDYASRSIETTPHPQYIMRFDIQFVLRLYPCSERKTSVDEAQLAPHTACLSVDACFGWNAFDFAK
jgi:hypothetical protein